MIQPLVSVIIPTYNRKAYVQQAIDSVLAQTYPHYEIIVIDDGSTDGTGEALAARYGDRITYHWQENRGESAARNWGICVASGDYLALLDSDDVWYPEKLAMQIDCLLKSKEMGFVTCLGEAIDNRGRVIADLKFGQRALQFNTTFEQLYQEYMVGNTSCVVISRAFFDAIGGFDETIRYGEDWDLFLRLAAISSFTYIPKVMVKMRIHDGGQWYFPNAKKIPHTLNDHVKILEKGFQVWPNREPWAELIRNRKLADVYGRAALEYFAFDNVVEGKKALTTAWQLDQNTWTNIGLLKPRILHLLYTLEDTPRIGRSVGTRYLNNLITSLSILSPLKFENPNEIIGMLALEACYYYSENGDRSKTLKYLIISFKMNPYYLTKKGPLYIILKMLFGDNVAAQIKANLNRAK